MPSGGMAFPAVRDACGIGRVSGHQLESIDMPDERSSLSGLTADEAKTFHGLFMTGFIVFTVIAIIAHFLVWQWRPWLPGPEGYAAVVDGVKVAVSQFTSFVA